MPRGRSLASVAGACSTRSSSVGRSGGGSRCDAAVRRGVPRADAHATRFASTRATSRSRCPAFRSSRLDRPVRRSKPWRLTRTTSSSDRKRTRVLAPGKSQAITVDVSASKGSFTLPLLGLRPRTSRHEGHVRRLDEAVAAPTAASTGRHVRSRLARRASGPSTDRCSSRRRPATRDRLFVVEQTGTVRVVRDGEVLPTPFLDLRDKVKISSEPGLLSIAFAPDYATSGLFYAFYNSTAGNGDIHIAEFRRHPTDPDLADLYSERLLLTIVKPWENHNGGMLQFGPDGYLYASVGDGDSGVLNPPGVFAQRLDDLLGKHPADRPAPRRSVRGPGRQPVRRRRRRPPGDLGLRPPQSVALLDRPRDGRAVRRRRGRRRRARRSTWSARPAAASNFGWPCFEGSLAVRCDGECDGRDRATPRVPARRTRACAVIGGVVVARRAAARARRPLPLRRLLRGQDHRASRSTNGAASRRRGDLGLVVPELTSFGVDGLDRIYVMSLSGDVYRLDPKTAAT